MVNKEAMMSDKDHLRVEDYASAAKRPDGAGLIARDVQRHLVAVCTECQPEWRRLGELRETYLSRLRALPGPPPAAPCGEELSATSLDLDLQAAVTADRIRLHRNVLTEKSDLLRTRADRRVGKIRRARQRFRSPHLAEMLIDESRKRVRDAPIEAAEIAALVPEILAWTEDERPVPPWAPPLLARAAAHRANALRVAGDLPAAERAFAELRHRLADRPLAEPGAMAEIASLEASLCIDQRRFEAAEERLERAALGYRAADDRVGLARAKLKQANLMRNTGRPAEVVRLLELEALDLETAADPYLYVCAVNTRANALCDLEEFTAAERLLDERQDAYEASEDLNVGAIYRCLRGRVALGLGRLERAEADFRDAREATLTLGRTYDAALITLYLAEALLAAGKTRDLSRLAGGLVAAFRGRGVEGEALAALRLLAQAVAAESVTATLLVELRRRLSAASSHSIQSALSVA
jgi:tetratricopeptide (TPR) repeat protein